MRDIFGENMGIGFEKRGEEWVVFFFGRLRGGIKLAQNEVFVNSIFMELRFYESGEGSGRRGYGVIIFED